MQERNAAGSLTQQFVRGTSMGGGIGGILYSGLTSPVRRYFVYNAIGSTVAIVSGFWPLVVESTNDYDAFGNVVATTGATDNDRLFCTKERSSGIGLDNFGFRYYDPVLGRFLTRDPAGYPDGPNNYLYCNNNPINHIDPLGLSAEQAEKVRNAKEVFDTFRDSVQGLTNWNPVSKFAHGISNQLVDSAVKRTADALDYATDSYAEAAYVGAGSVAAENAPVIGATERLVTGERINDETGQVEKTSTTQKVVDAISLGADVAAMVPGKGKAVTTLVDKVKGVFGKGAASVGDDVIAAGARAGVEQVDPATLRLPPSRAEGADPFKLSRQMKEFGSSTEGMPSIQVTKGANGEKMINDGVTRATRIDTYNQINKTQTTVPVEVIEETTHDLGKLPTVRSPNR